jgi:hypothetical protein
MRYRTPSLQKGMCGIYITFELLTLSVTKMDALLSLALLVFRGHDLLERAFKFLCSFQIVYTKLASGFFEPLVLSFLSQLGVGLSRGFWHVESYHGSPYVSFAHS